MLSNKVHDPSNLRGIKYVWNKHCKKIETSFQLTFGLFYQVSQNLTYPLHKKHNFLYFLTYFLIVTKWVTYFLTFFTYGLAVETIYGIGYTEKVPKTCLKTRYDFLQWTIEKEHNILFPLLKRFKTMTSLRMQKKFDRYCPFLKVKKVWENLYKCFWIHMYFFEEKNK